MSSIIGVLSPAAYQELEHDEIFSEDQLVTGQEIYIVKRERLLRATILDADEVSYTLDIFDGTEDEPSAVTFRTSELPMLVPFRTLDEVAAHTAVWESDSATLDNEPSTVDPLGEFVETDRLLECSAFSDAVWAVYHNEKQLEATVCYAGWLGSEDNPAALTDKVDELLDTLSTLKVHGYNYAIALERLNSMIAKL